MYCDPQPGAPSAAAASSHRILCAHIHRIALAGRLRVSEERAAGLVHAAACGAVLTLLSIPEETRDMGLAELARDAVFTAITTGSPVLKTLPAAPAATALRALLPEADLLSPAERTLLKEWLDRLANG